MNIADGCILIATISGVLFAWRRSALLQAGGFLGAILGMIVASLLYEKVAFLTESSSVRTAVLIAVLAGSVFLVADILVVLARWIEKNKLHKFRETLTNKIASSSVTGLGILSAVYVVATAFAGTLPSAVQEQIKSSAVLALLSEHVALPQSITKLASLQQPFISPDLFSGQEIIFDRDTSVLTGAYGDLDAATAAAKASMVRVTTWGCGSVATGSGFAIDSRHVMTNAHVVAGGERISLESGSSTLVGTLVWFDPKLDIAILHTHAALEGPALTFNADIANSGMIAAHLGYTSDAGLRVSDLVVLEKIQANGYDIFKNEQVTREIYALRGEVIPGNSGGPVIDTQGRVLGIIIGHSTTQNRTGYAIVANQVLDVAKKAPALVNSVSAGGCIAG